MHFMQFHACTLQISVRNIKDGRKKQLDTFDPLYFLSQRVEKKDQSFFDMPLKLPANIHVL
jgi:hypothetical protein